MPPRTTLLRIAPWAGGLLLVMGSLISHPAQAAEPEPEPDSTPAGSEATADAESEAGGSSWGPVVGACFGVLFGGALAVWQIRGMKNRG